MDLDRFDPRSRMMLVACISTLAIIWRDPALLAGLFCVTALVLVLGRAGAGAAARRLRGIAGLIAVLFVVQCAFVRSGEPLVSVGHLTLVTVDGMTVALAVTLRLAIVVCSALILLAGATRDYLLALVQCRVPYELAFMVMSALHFLPLLRDEALDVYNAVQMRGTEVSRASLHEKLRVYATIALPIVAGAIRRAEQVSLAMEARGFRAGPRTFMRRLTLAPRDVFCLVALPLLTVGLLLAPIV